ncbi:MAG TPA: hypothetical protein ENK91_12520, partial [Bacteroidetes bacterium]|nr:hypothetical protein [Bacteroidota bacterium]
MIRKLLLFAVLSIITYNSFGQILRPVRWRWKVEKISDNEYKMIFNARIQDTWSLYSQHIGEGGPVPTSFTFDEGDQYKLIGDMVESDNVEEMHDKVFDMKIKKFHHNASFTQKIKVLDKSKPVTGYLTFMTCDDTRCLPPTDIDFKFDFAKWDRAFSTHDSAKKKDDNQSENEVKSSVKTDNTADKSNIENAVEEEISNGAVAKQTSELDVEDQPGIEEVNSEKSGKEKIPVKWKFEVDKIDDNESILRFTATMDKGWDVYSIYTEDNGPIPTSINFEEKEGIEILGKPTEKGHFKEGQDPMFGVVVKKFLSDQPYQIEQKIKVKDKSKPLKGYISYQSCDDERCIFLEENFAFDLVTGKPIAKNESKNADENSAQQSIATGSSPNSKYNFDKTNINSECGTLDEANDSNKYSSWWLIFLAGFVGGLLAFLTPCVFPMVPLTVSFFTKRSGTRSKGIRNAIYYGLSIIVIYVIMGLLVTGLFGADALNQLSTNAWFNISFAILFIVFAISFFGFFEITLPSSWANKSDSMA